ncbi:MAG: hypothetical protein HOP17_14855 [Acidobacteria bacterium]|nr:hypothetical protein [Acidobacteriota bacterium]
MRSIIALTILLLAGTALSQTSLKNGPKVNGIGLGASREEVIRKLGKPTSQSKKAAEECVGGTEMVMTYPGLTFRLWDDSDNPRKFTVGFFEVRSARWNVSGAKVGETSAAIKKRFGTRASQETDGHTKLMTWYYDMDENSGPGSTNFAFRGGKVFEITSLWLMC